MVAVRKPTAVGEKVISKSTSVLGVIVVAPGFNEIVNSVGLDEVILVNAKLEVPSLLTW